MTASELGRLARDRRQLSRELHLPSAFYGNAAALKRYAGIPPRTRLKVAIEHGIVFTDFVWGVDLQAAVPTFMCASPARAERYAALASDDRIAVPIGPMIMYAPPRPTPQPPRRLVAFPAHSTHHVDAVYDVERFARRLERYRADWDDIEVCVYWRDVLRGAHEIYRDRGFRCVTAGHIYDPAFLTRLRAILEGATVVASNEIGSYLVHAVALERPVWLQSGDIDYVAQSQAVLERDRADGPGRDDLSSELRELFAEEREDVSDEQRTAIDEFAGLASHRSPDEMRRLLTEAEERYRAAASMARRGADAMRADAVYALSKLRLLRTG